MHDDLIPLHVFYDSAKAGFYDSRQGYAQFVDYDGNSLGESFRIHEYKAGKVRTPAWVAFVRLVSFD